MVFLQARDTILPHVHPQTPITNQQGLYKTSTFMDSDRNSSVHLLSDRASPHDINCIECPNCGAMNPRARQTADPNLSRPKRELEVIDVDQHIPRRDCRLPNRPTGKFPAQRCSLLPPPTSHRLQCSGSRYELILNEYGSWLEYRCSTERWRTQIRMAVAACDNEYLCLKYAVKIEEKSLGF